MLFRSGAPFDSLAAAAVVVVVAAVTRSHAAVAAVAQQEHQDDDPPQIVAAEAVADTIVAAHNTTSEFGIFELRRSFHVIPYSEFGANCRGGFLSLPCKKEGLPSGQCH